MPETLLQPEDLLGFKPKFAITFQSELDEFEAENITQAQEWLTPLRIKRADPCDEAFLRKLHKQMFGEVWDWAGTYRLKETNLGIDPRFIPVTLSQDLLNVRYWLDHQTFPPDEIAARLHYLTVHIHPFRNGNGRCTRLLADILLRKLGREPFTWGGRNVHVEGPDRDAYHKTLNRLDANPDDIAPLIAFART